MTHGARGLIATSVLVMGVTAIVVGMGSARGDEVVPLSVSWAKTPPVPDRQIDTSGTFPAVSDAGLHLTWANLGIRRALIDDEDRFAAYVRSHPADPRTAPGQYETSPKVGLMSASSVVVSALIPAIEILPGLNGGATWVSMTVNSASGRQVRLADLFIHPAQGLKTLAAEARRRLVHDNICVRDSVAGVASGDFPASGFNPTFSNYRFFALLARGIAIGFPGEQVSNPVCGRVSITVPYKPLAPYLSVSGKQLIAGVRAAH